MIGRQKTGTKCKGLFLFKVELEGRNAAHLWPVLLSKVGKRQLLRDRGHRAA